MQIRGAEQLAAELAAKNCRQGSDRCRCQNPICVLAPCQEGPNVVIYPEKKLVCPCQKRRPRRHRRAPRRRTPRPALGHHRFFFEGIDLPTARYGVF